jgi:GntR family transcriptional regulator
MYSLIARRRMAGQKAPPAMVMMFAATSAQPGGDSARKNPMRLDTSSGIPLYVQVRERLRSELDQMQQGEPIPVEAELEKRFGVSRITIRRAIEELADDGLLLRQQGKGTFVQRSKLTHELSLITSWTDQLKRLGFVPRTAHRKCAEETAPSHVVDALRLAQSEKVVRIERVRLAQREPISYMINYIPSRLVPGFMQTKFKQESLYELLENKYGLFAAMAVDTVGSRPATNEEAAALKIDKKAPVLSVRRLSYLEDGTPMELAVVTSRGDRYQYEVTLRGRLRNAGNRLAERLAMQPLGGKG